MGAMLRGSGMAACASDLQTIETGILMKASDLFVRALENEGVTHIFAVPGEENLELVESLRRSSIELVLTLHDQSAAFMAATHGRLTGRTRPFHGRCVRTPGGDADDFHHRAKSDHDGTPSAFPDRRHFP